MSASTSGMLMRTPNGAEASSVKPPMSLTLQFVVPLMSLEMPLSWPGLTGAYEVLSLGDTKALNSPLDPSPLSTTCLITTRGIEHIAGGYIM